MKIINKALFLVLIAMLLASCVEKEDFEISETVWIPEEVNDLPPFETASTITLTGDTVPAQPLSIIQALYPNTAAQVQTYESNFDGERQSTAAIFSNGRPQNQLFRLIYPESSDPNAGQNGSNETQHQFAIVKYDSTWEMGLVLRGRSDTRNISTVLRADFNSDTLHRVDAFVQQYDAAGIAISGSFEPITLFSRRLEQLQNRDTTFAMTFVRNPVKIATFVCEGGELDGQSFTQQIPFDFNQIGTTMGVLTEEREDENGNFFSNIDVTYDKDLEIYVPIRNNDRDYFFSLENATTLEAENATLAFIPEPIAELRFSDFGIATFNVDVDGTRTLSKLTRVREDFPLQTIRVQEADILNINATRFQTFVAGMDEQKVLGHLDRN